MGPIRSCTDIRTVDASNVRPINLQDFEEALRGVRSSVATSDLEFYKKWNDEFGSFPFEGFEGWQKKILIQKWLIASSSLITIPIPVARAPNKYVACSANDWCLCPISWYLFLIGRHAQSSSFWALSTDSAAHSNWRHLHQRHVLCKYLQELKCDCWTVLNLFTECVILKNFVAVFDEKL